MSNTRDTAKRAPRSRGDARERLLASAETLIARHGVDGVSIRGINAEAGVSPGILHYHFGSMDNLVEALLERHMRPLIEARAERLQDLQAQPAVTVRELVDILVLPLARKVIEEGEAGLRYVRLLARLYADRSPQIERITGDTASAPANFTPVLMSRALPGIPPEVLSWRMHAASHAMLHSLARLDEPQPGMPEDDAGRRAFQWRRVRALIEFICGGLAAPHSAA